MIKYLKNLKNNNQKNLLAFELGIIVSQVAAEKNIEVDSAMVQRAEEIITKEFKIKTAEEIATELNILALVVFEH